MNKWSKLLIKVTSHVMLLLRIEWSLFRHAVINDGMIPFATNNAAFAINTVHNFSKYRQIFKIFSLSDS